jgi:hypothetical protein
MKKFCLAISPLLLLAGCDDAPKVPSVDRRPEAERIAVTKLTERRGVSLREVQTFNQARPGIFAVCGQISFVGEGAFVPFVSVVTLGTDGARADHFIARSVIEANRTYIETALRCSEGAGPPVRGVQPLPPMPPASTIHVMQSPPVTEPVAQPRQTVPQRPAEPATAASGTVVLRSHGNLRSRPSGGGEVARIAPPGARLTVFGTAPGGWLEVGEGSPQGWLHSSRVDGF